MDLGLADKHVLITGGSRGIGLACAHAFAKEGSRVSIVARSQENLAAAKVRLHAQGFVVEGFGADLSEAQAAKMAVDSAVEVRGPIDVLVNCAGAARRVPFDELTPLDWHNAMEAKFFPYINVIDPVIKDMGKRGAGVIVNVIGMGGKIATTSHLSGGAANAALMLATAGLAAAYGPRGVRVNAVNPTLTLTDRMEQGLAAEARGRGISQQEALRQAKERIPLGRLAEPGDIANTVVFLSSGAASYLSGAILSVDGASSPIVV